MRNPRFSSAAWLGGAVSRLFPRGILARPRDTSIAPDNGRLALMVTLAAVLDENTCTGPKVTKA